MAGLGFGGKGGGRAGISKTMGIQFVKSSDSFAKKHVTNSTRSADNECKVRTDNFHHDEYDKSRKAGFAGPSFGAPARQFSSADKKDSLMQNFVRASEGEEKPASFGGSWRGYGMPGSVNLSKGAPIPQACSRVPSAKPVLTAQEYQRVWREEKDPTLQKIRKLAWEVVTLKSNRPNAIDKLHSAANRVPTRVEFNTEPVFSLAGRGKNSFMCHVFIEGISVGSGQGLKIKDAKINGYEIALQRILMPELRVVQVDPEVKKLQGSEKPFTSPPPKASITALKKTAAQLPPSSGGSRSSTSSVKSLSSQHKESNMEAAAVKRRIDEQRPLEDFVIVEPLVPIPDCTPAHTLRRSADSNHMLLEYEYFFQGEAVRCVLKIEGQVLADVNGNSKLAAKNRAAEQALMKLKKICWVIKTKQAVDSDTKISKEEMLNELTEESDALSDNNVGNKLLRKMGWSGGGVGKDGSGIAEPVSLKSVLNREGLGLGTEKGITDEYRRRVKEVIENYAASGNQEDLVFNCDFRLEERLIIHDECRRLNLRSRCKGKGSNRYLCVRRKRSASMLLDHIMSCKGETVRYKLVPPGGDLPQGSIGSTNVHSSSNHPGNDLDTKTFLSSGYHNEFHSKRKHAEMCDKKWAFGPPPPTLMAMNGNSMDQKFKQQIVGVPTPNPRVSQDIRNYPSIVKKEMGEPVPAAGQLNTNSGNDLDTKTFLSSGFHNEFHSKRKYAEMCDKKWAFGPPPPTLMAMNGNSMDQKFKQPIVDVPTPNPRVSQDIRNYPSIVKKEMGEPVPAAGQFNTNSDGTSDAVLQNIKLELGQEQENAAKAPLMKHPGNRRDHNENFSIKQEMGVQHGLNQQPRGIECNSSMQAVCIQSAGLHNGLMGPGRVQNHVRMPGSGQFMQNTRMSAGMYAMQRSPFNMNPNGGGGGGQWFGNCIPNIHQQQQQFRPNAAQMWGQMATQWAAAQGVRSMNRGRGRGGPGFNLANNMGNRQGHGFGQQ